MPLVHRCAYADCTVLTMGEYCLEHERENEALDAPLTNEATAFGPTDAEAAELTYSE